MWGLGEERGGRGGRGGVGSWGGEGWGVGEGRGGRMCITEVMSNRLGMPIVPSPISWRNQVTSHMLVHSVTPCRQKNLIQSFGKQKLQRRRDINTNRALMFMLFQVSITQSMHSSKLALTTSRCCTNLIGCSNCCWDATRKLKWHPTEGASGESSCPAYTPQDERGTHHSYHSGIRKCWTSCA